MTYTYGHWYIQYAAVLEGVWLHDGTSGQRTDVDDELLQAVHLQALQVAVAHCRLLLAATR